MKRALGPLSYANVVATLALFIALGGSSYAAVKLNGKDIKKNTVAGKALKKDTLGGREIKESKLAKVPSATTADSAQSAAAAALAAHATTADTASSVGGVTVTSINKQVVPTPTATVTTLYTQDGLTLEGLCSDGSGFPNLRVNSSANSGYVYSTMTNPLSVNVFTSLDGLLDNGESVDIDLNSPPPSAQYHVTLRSLNGQVATVEFVASRIGNLDGLKCRYSGVAFAT